VETASKTKQNTVETANKTKHGGNCYQKICLLQPYTLTFNFPPRKPRAFPPHPVLPTSKYKKPPQEGLCGKRAKATRKFVTEHFKNLCKTAWSKPYNFVVIDLTSPKNCGKYRSGFDNFYIIE